MAAVKAGRSSTLQLRPPADRRAATAAAWRPYAAVCGVWLWVCHVGVSEELIE